MSTTKNEVREWLERGIERSSTHVIIAVDTWDHEDYPVFVSRDESVYEKINSYDNKQNRIMEVYNLSIDIDEQLNQYRVWNI